MSLERDPFAGLAELQQLAELESRAEKLESHLGSDDFAAPEIRDAYQIALDRITEESITLASNEQVQAAVVDFGAKALQGWQQLEPVRGILPEEQIRSIEEKLELAMAKADAFFKKYPAEIEEVRQYIENRIGIGGYAVAGAVDGTETIDDQLHNDVQETMLGSEDRTTVEADSEPKTIVRLYLTEKGVRIGKQGHTVPYRHKVGKRRDYSEERIAALRFLVENSEFTHRRSEIWAAIRPGEAPDLSDFSRVATWFDKISFRKSTIILAEKQRYGINPTMDVSIFERRISKNTGPSESKQEEPRNEDESYVESGAKHLSEQMIGDLKLGDLYMLAWNLETLDYVLEAYGKPSPSHELKRSLERYRPDSDLAQLNHNGEDLKEYRKEVFDRVRSVFDDDTKFELLIESLGENPHITYFVEYLTDIMQTVDDREFIGRLITSRRVHNHRQFRGIIEEVSSYLVDDMNRVIWPIEICDGQYARTLPEKLVTEKVKQSPADKILVSEGEGQDRQIAEVASDSNASKSGGGETAVQPEEKERRVDFRRREQIRKVHDKAKQTGERFVAAFGNDRERKIVLGQLQSIIPGISRKVLTERDNGSNKLVSGKSQRPELNLREVMELALTIDRGVVNIVKQKPNRKIIDRVLDELAESLAADTE